MTTVIPTSAHRAGPGDAPAGPRVVRGTVAVLLSRFPLITETFILREMLEMERQGQPVRVVPLLREEPRVVHPEAARLVPRALYTPLLSPAIVRANARALARSPVRYVRVLARVLWSSRASANAFTGTLGIFPKSVYLAERLREEGVAHVHAHFATHPAMAAYIIHRFAGIGYSITAHAHDIFLRKSRAMLPEKVRRAAFLRVISRFNKEFLARHVDRRLLDDKTVVVHCGVRHADYGRLPAPARTDADSTPRIVCVAAHKPYKGLPVLIAACRLLAERGVRFECEIIGDGPMRPQLERLVRDDGLDDRVHLLGALPQQEVARRLASATVFALPSIVAEDGWMDGIPVALMEAMAAGRPVVTSAISGIPELVEHDVTGLLVPHGDAAALAAALTRLLDDPSLRERLADRARAKVAAEFDLSSVVADLVELCDAGAEVPGSLRALLEGTALSPVADAAVGVRRVRERKDSIVAELLLARDDSAREVVLKAHRTFDGESSPASERAERERATLLRLAATFASLPADGGPSLGVPGVVAADVANAVLLLERCDGVPLDELIRAARTSSEARRRLEHGIAGAGAWLAAMQRELETPAPDDPAAALVGRVQRALHRCRELGVLTLTDHRSAREIADRLAARLRRPATAVARHGDFWPGNVFVGERTIQVIDFEGAGAGLPEEDVGYFLVHLELFHSLPLSRRALPGLRRLFLGQLGASDPAALALARIEAAALSLAAQAPHRTLAARRRRAVLRHMILEAAKEARE